MPRYREPYAFTIEYLGAQVRVTSHIATDEGVELVVDHLPADTSLRGTPFSSLPAGYYTYTRHTDPALSGGVLVLVEPAAGAAVADAVADAVAQDLRDGIAPHKTDEP